MLSPSELILNADGSVYHLGLHPEDVADTVLVVGDPDRVAKVSQYFDAVERRVQRREFVTHTGRLGRQRLTVISSGIGTDNVEILLTELDALVNVDLGRREEKIARQSLRIVRLGTSGSLQPDIPVDSYVASTTAIGLDTLMSFYTLPQTEEQHALTLALQERLGLPFQPYHAPGAADLQIKFGSDMAEGHTVTCPGFYAPQGRAIRLAPKVPHLVEQLRTFAHGSYRLTNFEMETAGYYALCQLLGHQMVSLNAIVANRITHQFSNDGDRVIDGLIQKVLGRMGT